MPMIKDFQRVSVSKKTSDKNSFYRMNNELR